jgi:hypothetical protein
MSLHSLTEGQLLIRLEEGRFVPLMVRRRRLDKILGHVDQVPGE